MTRYERRRRRCQEDHRARYIHGLAYAMQFGFSLDDSCLCHTKSEVFLDYCHHSLKKLANCTVTFVFGTQSARNGEQFSVARRIGRPVVRLAQYLVRAAL